MQRSIMGAKTTREGELTVSMIPGARLFFTRAESAPAPTRSITRVSASRTSRSFVQSWHART